MADDGMAEIARAVIERIDRHCGPIRPGWRRRSCPVCCNLGEHDDRCPLEALRAAVGQPMLAGADQGQPAAHGPAGVAAGPQATPRVLGYVVLSDHIDRSTGKQGIDLNWDGELHPTREAAEESAADARDESHEWWVEIGTVTLPAELTPQWVVAVPTGTEDQP